ncbi:MAG: AraC family ligand binding domain-containing protein [Bacteroides sp.]|nr:AraC family ligand binding domain-containing protein [Bacteroides sp.]
MKTIPQYTFYRTKYGDELLVDLVRLDYIKHYLSKPSIHTLTYYDITFITEGSGFFNIDNRKYGVCPGDVIFSAPGEIRRWDCNEIRNRYALIFEEKFLLTFFNDTEFQQKLSSFDLERKMAVIRLDDKLFDRILSSIRNIKEEIDTHKIKDHHFTCPSL